MSTKLEGSAAIPRMSVESKEEEHGHSSTYDYQTDLCKNEDEVKSHYLMLGMNYSTRG